VAQLIVRNLETELVRQLKIRAARNNRSAEAEHREILRQVLMHPAQALSFKEALLAMPDAGEDSDFTRSLDQGRKVDL